jgi:hypothetical protein
MGDTGEGEGSDQAADAAAAEAAGDGDGAAGERRWPARPVALLAAATAGVVLLSGVALAALGGERHPPEAGARTEPSGRSTSTTAEAAETTSTTVAPTTTVAPAPPVTEPAATAAPPSSRPPATQGPAPPRTATCFRPWPPFRGGTLPTVVGGPGKFVAFGPPTPGCVDVDDGCLVSITLGWSDGYTEVGSAVLAEPGQYPVNGDRGTTWMFTVSGDRVCSSSGGNYSNVWPPGT